MADCILNYETLENLIAAVFKSAVAALLTRLHQLKIASKTHSSLSS